MYEVDGQLFYEYKELDGEAKDMAFDDWVEHYELGYNEVDFEFGNNAETRHYFEEHFSEAYCYYECGTIKHPLAWLS